MKISKLFQLVILILLAQNSIAQSPTSILHETPTPLQNWIDQQFEHGLDSFNIPGASFVLISGDSILHMKGYGIEDIKTKNPVDAETSIFRIASISKTFVATSIMQLHEQGKIDLEGDANHFLTSYQLPIKFGRSITIKDLLTHSAGIDEGNVGAWARSKEEMIPLAEHINEFMPSQIRQAGKAFTYSNYSFGLLGLIVADISGMPYDEYVSKNILKPLQMNRTSYQFEEKYAKDHVISYSQNGNQLIPNPVGFTNNYPEGGLFSTAGDMSRYVTMHMNQGSYQGIQILKPSSIERMRQLGYKNFEASEYGWLLGMFDSQWNGYQMIGHGGDYQGFASEFRMIPEKNLGLFIVINASSIPESKTRNFMYDFMNKLWGKLIPDEKDSNQKSKWDKKDGQVDLPLKNFAGSYRFTRYAQGTLEKLGIFIGFAPEVNIVVEGDHLKVLEWNETLTPSQGLTFFAKEYQSPMAFGKNESGEIGYFYSNGASSFHKLKFYEKVNFQMFWIGSIVLIFLSFLLRSIFKRKNWKRVHQTNFAIVLLSLFSLGIIGYAMIMIDPQEFLYGLPPLVKFGTTLPILLFLIIAFGGWNLIKSWGQKLLSSKELSYQTLVYLAGVALIPWMWYFNLIGINF